MCSHCWKKPLVGVLVERSLELNDLVAMEVELEPGSMRGANASATLEEPSSSSLGWPFGLSSTCIAIHAPSPKVDEQSQAQPSSTSSPVLASFQQQFVNLQSTFLLPFFSDVGESSSSDSEEVRSEAASSFFKDSRRITLGSLIGLPMDDSFHHFDGAQFHVDLATTTTPRRSLQLPSCAGILELLRCGRPFSDANSFGLSDHEGEITAVSATTTNTLAAFLQVESTGEIITKNSVYDDVACADDDTLSTSSHSPDWNDQFVSCHSVLSVDAHPLASSSSPKASSTASQKLSNRMQRSASMKSFFASICCRVDTVHRP